MINTNRATLLLPSHPATVTEIVHADPKFSTIAAAIASAVTSKVESTIVIPEGDYKENVTVPDKVSLTGKGAVNIIGTVNLDGKGSISNIAMQTCIVQGGANRILEKCEFAALNVQPGGIIHARQIFVQNTLNANRANIFISTSTISGSPAAPVALILAAGTTCSIEASTIEGSTQMSGKTILDCKQSNIVGMNTTEDLFTVSDPESVLQLFNCTVTGQSRIKSGPGSSVRANVIALGSANVFTGGKDVKLADV